MRVGGQRRLLSRGQEMERSARFVDQRGRVQNRPFLGLTNLQFVKGNAEAQAEVETHAISVGTS
jgi:hypothetical protein